MESRLGAFSPEFVAVKPDRDSVAYCLLSETWACLDHGVGYPDLFGLSLAGVGRSGPGRRRAAVVRAADRGNDVNVGKVIGRRTAVVIGKHGLPPSIECTST